MKITPADIGREVLITVLGAIGAAFIVGQLPQLKAWMKKQWDGSK